MSRIRGPHGTMGLVGLLSINEAVAASGVSRRTIYRLIEAGKIAKYRRKHDRTPFVDLDQLRAARGYELVSGPAPASTLPSK
jgi:excisionase family DNA binding protein